MHELQVPARSARIRLDQFLVGALPHLSRSRLQSLVKSGHVLLNGKPARSSERVAPGDRVSVEEPPPVSIDALPENIPLDVLFEDADLAVIDKPAGLVVHPAAGNPDGTLVNALLHRFGGLSAIGGRERPGIVHRLDKETSGCLVVARNDTAHQALAAQFAGREIGKIYLALVEGRFPRKHLVIEEPIGRHPVHRQKMAVVPAARGRSAKTELHLEAQLPCGALLRCVLHTGRTHQIRVHLKHLGHPVLGDKIYGHKPSLWPRHMLHAWKLELTHPRTGLRVRFASPVPADFVQAGVDPDLK